MLAALSVPLLQLAGIWSRLEPDSSSINAVSVHPRAQRKAFRRRDVRLLGKARDQSSQCEMNVPTSKLVAATLPVLSRRKTCNRRQNFRISSTWSCANPSRILAFPLIVTVLAA
jgi:hypothetical protein